MTNVLKGNFKTKREVKAEDSSETVEGRFEKEALKHLGGSICFVRKQEVHWGEDDGESDE